LWKIPYNSLFWETINPIQWRIFAEHIFQDQKEKLETDRDLAEYAMAFHNYEAVVKVQEARENRDDNQDRAAEEAFMQQLKNMGIDLDKQKLQQAKNQSMTPEEDIITVKYPKDK
jgi:hypothetical protein